VTIVCEKYPSERKTADQRDHEEGIHDPEYEKRDFSPVPDFSS
jgi:hypothetical protein